MLRPESCYATGLIVPQIDPDERRRRKLEKRTLLLDILERLGRSPDAVIDVGVRRGTPWLYDAFANAQFLLIDPQQGGERLLKFRPQIYTFINKAVGRSSGRMLFHEQHSKSTFLMRAALMAKPSGEEYEVEIVTLDDVISEHLPNARKIGLKIDTEGFELEVIAGLKKYSDRVDFIISETSVLNRFVNSYNFSQLICELWNIDFRFYNILNQVTHPAPRYYDCVFFHKDDAAFNRLSH